MVVSFILAVLGGLINSGQVLAQNCLPVTSLTYHHIQPRLGLEELAEIKLSVSPDVFSQQIEILGQKGYEFVSIRDITQSLEGKAQLSPKSIHLTFDDGYEDLYYYLFPIIKIKNIPVTIFLITGLMDVPGYLSWEQAREMAQSGLVYFGNHTWSHSYTNDPASYRKEIEVSERQLWHNNFNQEGVLAYPYGSVSPIKQEILAESGIKLAFTTKRGNQLCGNNKLSLPRVSMGEGDPKEYGL